MKTLFVGNDPDIEERVAIAARLRWPDTEIITTDGPADGLELLERELPDIVLLQSDADRHSGASFIQDVRAFSDVPLIVLEHEPGGGGFDEVRVLELGADDYIRRSAGIIEIVARMVALLRRVGRAKSSGLDQTLSSGTLTLNRASYEVYLDGKRLDLTPTEFRLLYLLLANRGNVVTHEFLARSIWGDEVDSSGLVKKYIQRVRRRLEDSAENPRWIASVHGVGYRLVASPEPVAQRQNGAHVETG